MRRLLLAAIVLLVTPVVIVVVTPVLGAARVSAAARGAADVVAEVRQATTRYVDIANARALAAGSSRKSR